MTQTATQVSKTDRRIGNGIRLDRTPGSTAMFISPFEHPYEIAIRLNCTRGGIWAIEVNRVGGNGDMTQAIRQDTREAVNLWQDARGRWYITKGRGGRGWLPDLDATEALVPVRLDEPIESMWAGHIRNSDA